MRKFVNKIHNKIKGKYSISTELRTDREFFSFTLWQYCSHNDKKGAFHWFPQSLLVCHNKSQLNFCTFLQEFIIQKITGCGTYRTFYRSATSCVCILDLSVSYIQRTFMPFVVSWKYSRLQLYKFRTSPKAQIFA